MQILLIMYFSHWKYIKVLQLEPYNNLSIIWNLYSAFGLWNQYGVGK